MKTQSTQLRLVSKTEDTPKISTRENPDGSVTVRIEAMTVAAPDELIAFPFGLERAAARAVVASGDLLAARIGRRLYARRSAVLALIEKLARKPLKTANVEGDEDAYAALVRAARSTVR